MTVRVVTWAERPDLAERGPASEDVWPEYNLHGDVFDEAMVRFVRDITEYADGRTPTPTTDPALSGIPLPRLTGLVTGLGSGRDEDEGGEDTSSSSNGPFIGVASRSRRDSVVTYYGIDHHDGWVFTPFYR